MTKESTLSKLCGVEGLECVEMCGNDSNRKKLEIKKKSYMCYLIYRRMYKVAASDCA